jgi:hypothetical protein
VGNSNLINDASGNLGLGVTPSAWLTNANVKALEIGYKGNAIYGVGGSDMRIISNAFFDGAYKYADIGQASVYQQNDGIHRWLTAPSGTAGNAISFTQAMTLDASGNLLVGTTSSGFDTGTGIRLERSGQATIRLVGQSSGGEWTMGSSGMQFDARVGYIRFITGANDGAATERMRITSGGNLLLGGTVDNGARLQVSGNQTISGTLGITGITTINNGSNAGVLVLGSPTFNGRIEHDATTTGSNIYTTSAASGGGHIFRVGASNVLSIASTGAATFSSSVTTGDNIVVGNPNSSVFFGTSAVGYGTSPAVGRTSTNGFHIQNSIAGDLCIGAEYNKSIIFGTGASGTLAQSMRITSGGNVLIGATTDNGARLQVSGNVNARLYIVNEASANRGGLYPYNTVAGSGTDYSVGIFSEGEIFLAAGGSATKRFTMSTTGAATFSSLAGTGDRLVQANSSGELSATQTIASGTYTPTITDNLNTSSYTVQHASYTRIGNICTVYMRVSFTASSSVCGINVTIPVGNNFSNSNQATGSNGNGANGLVMYNSTASASTNQIFTSMSGATVGSNTISFSFQYQVQ